MRGVFDEREAEQSWRRRGRDKRDREDGDEGKRDREVTLGSFTLLAIFLGLVMLCGLSFGLGYVVGRREPAATPTVLEPTPIAGQGDGAKGKPSGGSGSGGGAASEGAGAQGGAEAGQQGVGQRQGGDAADAGAAAAAPEGSKGTQQAVSSVGPGGPGTGQVKPALPTASEVSKTQQTQAKAVAQTQGKTVQPALESTATRVPTAASPALMVQVATLAHQDDADVLVEALKRRGYAVGAHRDAADGMVHVRVGPFASRDVANQWRQKLQNDGYNAQVESQ